MPPNLSDLEDLAQQAGNILRAYYGKEFRVDHKGVIDLVTEADHRSEEYLLGEIRRRFPGHRIVSEESGEQGGSNSCMWFVDPLDGTINFAHGVPFFAVSIAYQEDGLTRLAAIYDPMRQELFTAERGAGAWLNGKPIRVSGAADLDQSLLVTGFPYDLRTNPHNNLDHFIRLTLKTLGVRRLGSAALDLSYVAAGRFDGFWELRIGAWDVAAGGLIAEQAGALVTNMRGGPDYLSAPQSILAATPALHPQLLAMLGD